MKKYLLLIIIGFIASHGLVDAQTVMGKPYAFDTPKHFVKDADNKYYIENTGKKHKKTAWLVFSDRNDNQTYEKDDLSSGKKRTLSIMDWAFVTHEKKEWVRLATGKLDRGNLKIEKNFTDLGWIQKSKLLLWDRGLKDVDTKIDKKVFLLNKVEDIDRLMNDNIRTFAKIFTGPSTSDVLKTSTIYDFYFVYKIENGRYLIGNEDVCPKVSVRDILIGWVLKDRLEEWNTRICLEPNFDPDAFSERQSNQNFQVTGFGSPNSAKQHASKGLMLYDTLWINNDPAISDQSKLARSDKRRFKGGVVRFPMLRSFDFNDGEYGYFKSGTIGEITSRSVKGIIDHIKEDEFSVIQGKLQSRKQKLTNYNLFFVVEGSRSMANYKEAIIKTIHQIDNSFDEEININYGAAVYRDTPEEAVGKLYNSQSLTRDKNEAIDFIDKIVFDQVVDPDPWTSLRYGMYQSLLTGNFSPDETNILVVLGNHADYWSDRGRKAKALQNSEETNIEWEKVYDLLAKSETDVIYVQCQHNGGRVYNKFADDGRNFIINAANKQYEDYSRVKEMFPDWNIRNPNLELEPGVTENVLSGGVNNCVIIKPEHNSILNPADLETYILKYINLSKTQTEASWEEVTNVVFGGEHYDITKSDDPSSGAFSERIAKEIWKLFAGRKGDEYKEKSLQRLIDEKWKLYDEIYIAKKVRGAEHPTLSFVLFMPEDDLRSYFNTLTVLERATNGSIDEIRTALYDTFRNLLDQFTGGRTSRKNADEINLEELSAIMQGVEDEGLVINDKYKDINIGDIRNNKKVDEDMIEKMIRDFRYKKIEIEKILNQRDKYEFIYFSPSKKRKYYWIPVDLAL